MKTKSYPTNLQDLFCFLIFNPLVYCHHSHEPFCGRRWFQGHEGKKRILWKDARGEPRWLDLADVYGPDLAPPKIHFTPDGFGMTLGKIEIFYVYMPNFVGGS